MIDDPSIILKALNNNRLEWETQLDHLSELEEFRNHFTQVNRCINKSVLSMACREFIDKKIFFKISEVDPSVSDDDEVIYQYVTSVPDELFQIDKKYVRSYSLIGAHRIGKRKDGPGCYVHGISQTEIKVNSWVCRRMAPLLAPALKKWT